ncbi:MAG: hypothetical protein F6K16_14005 [Symploca sp. SIO2B6]|nr:hypothetical protein [Symploca sp. SIO2B6]
MKKHRRFNMTFMAVTLPSLVTVGLFNLAIDPYGVIDSPEISGLNELRTQKFHNVRLFKAIDVTRVEPKTLLLGSSRTDLGLDPAHPALTNKQPAYNLGLVGPNIYEVKRYFEHSLANQPELKTVVLGIDLFMFNEYKINEVDFSEDRLEKENLTAQELLNVTLSTSAIQSSAKTIKSSIDSDAYYLYRPDGMRYVYGNEPNEPIPKKFKGSIGGLRKGEGYYKKYQLSEEFLVNLQEIVDICKQQNIELKVFISPSHASQWENLRAAELWSVFEEWKRQLVKITPVWDFSGYNTITTEAISKDMENYWDSSHYRKEVGDLVLNRIFDYQKDKVPTDFGVLLTQENIESNLAKINTQREIWSNNNSDVVEFVESLQP